MHLHVKFVGLMIEFGCNFFWLFCCTIEQHLQNGLDTKVEKSRKQMKERKNRAKKVRGVKKVMVLTLASAVTTL